MEKNNVMICGIAILDYRQYLITQATRMRMCKDGVWTQEGVKDTWCHNFKDYLEVSLVGWHIKMTILSMEKEVL